MARPTKSYVCQQCGSVQPKWSGRCDDCGAWNALVEEVSEIGAGGALERSGGAPGRRIELIALDGPLKPIDRLESGIGELDRVTGGGLVPGSALLIGGDPGIGKSTLLLQAAAALATQVRCIYISGEEAVDQLRMRADRLGVRTAPVGLASATSVRDIAATLESDGPVDVVVVELGADAVPRRA